MKRVLCLVLAACGPVGDISVSDNVEQYGVTGLGYIDNGEGQRFTVCGRGNKSATNRYLADGGHRFIVDYPAGFPSSYWGINKEADAYICFGVTHHQRSGWKRTTPLLEFGLTYDLLEVEIYGYRTTAGGTKIDVSGNGSIGDEDFIGLSLFTDLEARTQSETMQAMAVWEGFFGVQGFGTYPPIGIGALDANGYPKSALAGTSGNFYLSASMGSNNQYQCQPNNQSANCVYYGAYSGTTYRAFPAPGLKTGTFTFAHTGNNWVKFNASSDTFVVNRAPVSTFVNTVGFVPTFIQRAKETAYDFGGTVSP